MRTVRMFAAMMMVVTMALWIGTNVGAQQKVSIKIGHDSPESSHHQEFCKKFKEIVERDTKGQINVEIYPGAQLGSESAMFEQIQVGALQMALGSSTVLAMNATYGVFELPYLFRNRDHMIKVLDGPIGSELSGLLLPRNIRILTYADHGFRVITNNVRPIVKPEDLKGIKIRVPPSKLRAKIFNTYGAAATPMPFPELFMALQTGVVDGQENPLAYTLDNSFYEVQKYLSVSNHVYSPLYVLINEKFLQSLPGDARAVVVKAAAAARDSEREWLYQKTQTVSSVLLQKGMKINEVDTQAFIKASKPIWDEEGKTFPNHLIERIVKTE